MNLRFLKRITNIKDIENFETSEQKRIPNPESRILDFQTNPESRITNLGFSNESRIPNQESWISKRIPNMGFVIRDSGFEKDSGFVTNPRIRQSLQKIQFLVRFCISIELRKEKRSARITLPLLSRDKFTKNYLINLN